MALWHRLPVEVREKIWKTLADSVARERLDVDAAFQKRTSIAACAAVDRAWQAYFEQIFFRQLVLEGSDDVALFSIICGTSTKRLDYIRHLRLHIDVVHDECRHLDMTWIRDNETCPQKDKLTRALWPLLATLGTWTPTSGGHDPRLVLELSAGSRIDGQNTLRSFRLQRDYPFETAEDLARGDPARAHQFHVQRQTDQHNISPSYRDALLAQGLHRLGVDTDCISASMRYQVSDQGIDIVRELVIRRRFMYSFSASLLIQLLELGRRSIRSLRIENYSLHSAGMSWLTTSQNQKLYMPWLEEVHLHQEPDPFSDARRINFDAAPWSSSTLCAQSLAFASLPLKHLSVGGLSSIRASDFLDTALLFIMKLATEDAKMLAASQELTEEQLEEKAARVRETIIEIEQSGRSHLSQDFLDLLWAKRNAAKYSTIEETFFWPHLQTLALNDCGRGYAVIRSAGFAALEMPQLQILEIWSAFNSADDEPESDLPRSDNIFLFRFEAASPSHQGRPTVTLQGTRDMRLAWSPDISKAWNKKAATLSSHPLCVEFGILPGEDADIVLHKMPHVGIVKHLLLKDKVLDPVSRSQMEMEVLYGA